MESFSIAGQDGYLWAKKICSFFKHCVEYITKQVSFSRLVSLEVLPRPDVQCEAIAWRLVGLLGSEQGAALKARTSRLATALAVYTPIARDAVDSRRRQLDAAVQGNLSTYHRRTSTKGITDTFLLKFGS